MSALDIFDTIMYKKLRPIAKLCAADIFVSDFKINWTCALFELVMFLAAVSIFWTLHINDLETGLRGVCSAGSVIQVRKIKKMN